MVRRSLFIGTLLAAVLVVPALAEGDGPILSTSVETEVSIDWNSVHNVKGQSSFIRENKGRSRKRGGTRSRTRSNASSQSSSRTRSRSNRTSDDGGVSVTPKRYGAADTIKAYDKNFKIILAKFHKLETKLAEANGEIEDLKVLKADKPAAGGAGAGAGTGDGSGGGGAADDQEETNKSQKAPAVPFWEFWIRCTLFVIGWASVALTIWIFISAWRTPEPTPAPGATAIDPNDPNPRAQAWAAFYSTAGLTAFIWLAWFFLQYLDV